MSSNDLDDDLDAFAEIVAKRTADRESRLQRLAMLKRQQLENDEEEFQKSKKQASSKTNVLSTSSSPVKSSRQSTAFNYSSPSKNQFLPSFNSPQRSFVLTRSIEKSTTKSPEKLIPQSEFLSVTSPDQSNSRTPASSPEKQYNTPLKSASNSTIDICSPRPYQKSPHNNSPIKSPLKQFMCHSPSQGLIASNFSKKVVDFSSISTSSKSIENDNDISISSESPTKSLTGQTSEATTPIKSPTKSFNQVIKPYKSPAAKFSTESSSNMISDVQSNTNKRNISPVRLFSSVKSSNPIKIISPIKKDSLNTPEKLCVSDKKKLFENAIKEESENAKRVKEQQDFLLRKKISKNNFANYNEPSMPKKLKTSILEFENKFPIESSKPSWSSATKFVPESHKEEIVNNEQPESTAPKILDVEMKQLAENDDYSVREGDEISKFIDQVEETKIEESKSDHFENSSGPTVDEKMNVPENELINEKTIHDLESELNLDFNLIKSSTKANLYPSLSNFEVKGFEATNDLVESIQKVEIPIIQTPTFKESPIKQKIEVNMSVEPRKAQTNTPITPMRTLSQYRREQKQRVANNLTPSTRVNPEKERLKEEMERAKWIIYQNDLKNRLENLKMLLDKYDKAIEQSSNAIALCLKNPDQRGSSSQLAAEQILLVSTQRRIACKEEMEKIETKMKSPICRAPELPLATGCISIRRIQIPLKSDFIVGQVCDQDPLNHHFVCLIRCGERILETELLDSANSIQEASIIFDLNSLKFEKLDKDFEIQFELYGLALPKEKHHDKRSLLMHSIKIPPLSPKLSRSKKSGNQMLTYSANKGFTRLGHCKFEWNNILDKKYELEDCMFNSPFSGQIEIDFKMNAVYCPDIEMEDFLNVYDGKYWKSRYYVLKGYLLAYWNYKEDYADKNLPSLGTIDLRNCVNRKIGPVSLNVCARSYSFVLVIEEEALDTKHKFSDNKVHKITGQKSHTFAADSKEDFEKWCDHLNKLLPLIRIWEQDAQPPQDLKFLEW